MNYKTTRYHAVVETGGCSPDYQRWEAKFTCGHAHKTIESAEKCLSLKKRYYCYHSRITGTPCKYCQGYAKSNITSALWYNGRIHTLNGERI